MPTITKTIKYVNEPKEGKNRGSIKATDDTFLGVPQGLLRLFTPGKTYDIDYTEKGEWKTVTNATEARSEPRVVSSNPSAPTAPIVNKDEQIFVCAILKELIAAGHVKYDKGELWEATKTLRGLWGATFGERSTFHASEASRVARG